LTITTENCGQNRLKNFGMASVEGFSALSSASLFFNVSGFAINMFSWVFDPGCVRHRGKHPSARKLPLHAACQRAKAGLNAFYFIPSKAE
jgi:hypothetical protein